VRSPSVRVTPTIARPARISWQLLIVIQHLCLLLLLLPMMIMLWMLVVVVVVVVVAGWISQTVAERPTWTAQDPAGETQYCPTYRPAVYITGAQKLS